MPDVATKLCFVIGPIGSAGSDVRIHADWLLEGIIRPVLAEFPDYLLKRADHDPRPGLIDVQMINDILDAELVIADLSLLNPNAFYEIGIRHMAQKPIIHMQLEAEKPPFDVSLYRAVPFALSQFSDLRKAQGALKDAIEAVLAPDYQVENPITRARGRQNLEQHATPEMQVLLGEIETIKSQVELLQALVFPPPTPLDLAAALRSQGKFIGGDLAQLPMGATFGLGPSGPTAGTGVSHTGSTGSTGPIVTSGTITAPTGPTGKG